MFWHSTASKEELIQGVFPDIAQQFNNQNQSIVKATIIDVDELNATVLNFLPGDSFPFKSFDTFINKDDLVNYPTTFLNSMGLRGLSSHNLQLKIKSAA